MRGWPIVKLSEVCKFDRGLTYMKGDEVESDGTPVLRANNIDLATGRLDLSDVRYVSTNVAVPEAKRTRKGALLICTASGSKSHLGKVAYIDDAVGWAFGGFMGQITAKPSVDSRYLYYLLVSDFFRNHLGKRSEGININNLKFSDIADFEVPLPPLAEQKRIVAILDETFEGIAKATTNAERNLANARELSSLAFISQTSRPDDTWVECTLGDQFTLQRGVDITKSAQRSGHVPVVSSGGIRSFHDTAIAVAPGVVIGRKGSLGTAYFVEEDFWPHDTTLWVKDFKGNHPKFVFYVLKSLDLKALDSGAANPALNRNNVHPIAVRWPPIEVQERIVSLVDVMSNRALQIESLYEQKVRACKDLRLALLHKAFSGQLTGKEAVAA